MMLQHIREDKLSAIALSVIAAECLEDHGVRSSINISALCTEYELNRTQVYEKKAQIAAAMATLPGIARGRPRNGATIKDPDVSVNQELAESKLECSSLRFQQNHPGSVVWGLKGRGTYSDSYKRFTLDADDQWKGADDAFSRATGVPLSSLNDWRARDAKEPIMPQSLPTYIPVWPKDMTPTDLATRIAEDYRKWEGRIGPYIGHEARKLGVSGNSIRMVLRIVGVLSASEPKSHRYRGSTEKASPGAIIVTDGKTVTVNLRSTAEPCTANWQGVVDQATTCHLATVITPTESAAAVAKAYDGAVEFLGRAPAAFIHDQKPIHDDERLHMHIEPGTLMIPATLGRGQNKAGMEGEFGRYEKQVGAITIDDRTKQSLVETIVHEVVRAYQAGINHAGRVEFDGKSRVEIVRQACPDPKRDAELVAKLKATHPRGRRPADPLPTAGIVRTLLDDAFVRLTLVMDDTSRLRAWLAATFEPEAVRRALALFETKRAKGGIQGPYAHRYLVKLIQSHQSEINIERAVQSMLHYAEIESAAWLTNLQIEHTRLLAESSPGDYLNRLADKALCGNIVIENAFWEKALEEALASAPAQFTAVMVHIRRLYEVPEFRRLGLINRVMTHRAGLGRVPN